MCVHVFQAYLSFFTDLGFVFSGWCHFNYDWGVNRGQEESPKRLLEPGGKLVVDCGIGQSCGRCWKHTPSPREWGPSQQDEVKQVGTKRTSLCTCTCTCMHVHMHACMFNTTNDIDFGAKTAAASNIKKNSSFLWRTRVVSDFAL